MFVTCVMVIPDDALDHHVRSAPFAWDAQTDLVSLPELKRRDLPIIDVQCASDECFNHNHCTFWWP